MVQLNNKEEFEVDNGEFLNPRQMITSNPLFPESQDPYVDIVVVVSGDTTTRNQEYLGSRSGEIISFLMIFSCL